MAYVHSSAIYNRQDMEITCPSTCESIKMWVCVCVCVCVCVMKYYIAIKNNEIMPFAATWMDLEIINLNEVSRREKDKHYMLSLICGI